MGREIRVWRRGRCNRLPGGETGALWCSPSQMTLPSLPPLSLSHTHSYEMAKSKEMGPMLASRLRWRYLVLDEGAQAWPAGAACTPLHPVLLRLHCREGVQFATLPALSPTPTHTHAGHRIKNEDTQLAHALRLVHRQQTLLLTGTPLQVRGGAGGACAAACGAPTADSAAARCGLTRRPRPPQHLTPPHAYVIQNNMHELYALLSYLYPDIFTTAAPFDAAFTLATKEHKVRRETEWVAAARCRDPARATRLNLAPPPHVPLQVNPAQLEAAHHMLQPFCLRRLKRVRRGRLGRGGAAQSGCGGRSPPLSAGPHPRYCCPCPPTHGPPTHVDPAVGGGAGDATTDRNTRVLPPQCHAGGTGRGQAATGTAPHIGRR